MKEIVSVIKRHVSRTMSLLRMGAALFAAAALPLSGLHQPAGGEPQIHITQVDKSNFPVITVYVSVTGANGEPVGVDPNRIALSENGASVTPEVVAGTGEFGRLTTLLVIDISGSMNQGGKLESAKAAARAYVAQMRPGDQAGLLTFNTRIDYDPPITTDRERLKQAIDGLIAQNDTAMYDALAEATEILGSVEGRKAIITLTDGLDNRSIHTPDQVIEAIGPAGLSISTVGLGDPSKLGVTNEGLDETTLKSLAERAGGVYGFADDPESLRGLYEKYGRALQSEYAITYTTSAALRDGVNRSLTVGLAETTIAGQTQYNPGGVMPEVARTAAWPLFALILIGLLALLAAPVLLTRGAAALANLRLGWGKRFKKPSVRLADQPQSQVQSRTSTQSRIRLQ